MGPLPLPVCDICLCIPLTHNMLLNRLQDDENFSSWQVLTSALFSHDLIYFLLTILRGRFYCCSHFRKRKVTCLRTCTHPVGGQSCSRPLIRKQHQCADREGLVSGALGLSLSFGPSASLLVSPSFGSLTLAFLPP